METTVYAQINQWSKWQPEEQAMAWGGKQELVPSASTNKQMGCPGPHRGEVPLQGPLQRRQSLEPVSRASIELRQPLGYLSETIVCQALG